MKRLLTIGSLAAAFVLLPAAGALAHVLPIAHAREQAKPAVQRYWEDRGLDHPDRRAPAISACRRLSDHVVRCRSKAFPTHFDKGPGVGLATVTVRFPAESSSRTRATVTQGTFEPFDRTGNVCVSAPGRELCRESSGI
jgi:hypothetical protein